MKARPAPSLRGLRRAGVASGCALALCVVAAGPASAAVPATRAAATTTTSSTSTAGATSASSVRLTINLPAGTPLGASIQLDVDPVAGTVRAVPGSNSEAEAVAAVLSGTLAGQSQSLGGADAKLPSPTSVQGSPLDALNTGIAGSPLADFLALQAANSSADVTTAPSSTSTAGTTLGIGLPTALATPLKAVFDQLIAGLNDVLAGLAPVDTATQALCAGLTQVVDPANGVAQQIPVLGPIVTAVTTGLTDPQIGVLCNIRTTLGDIVTKLGTSLDSLGGPGGLLSLGLLQTSQSITTATGKVTSTAKSQVGNVRILGQNPFGTAQALTTTSTATAPGTPGGATATVDAAAVNVAATPLALFTYDLTTLKGQIAGIDLAGVNDLLAQIQAILDALAGVGVQGGRVGAPTDAIASCPTALTSTLSGTFKAADGTCAAAAAEGYGLAVTLPDALATAVGITGPLVQLTFSPSAAVARSVTTTTTTTTTEACSTCLAHTGLETPLSAAGLALLVTAAYAVRRRRSAAA